MIDVIQETYADDVQAAQGVYVSGVQWTPTDILLPEALTYEQWAALLSYAANINSSSKWWIAKLVNEGEYRYGEKYIQAVSMTGMTYRTVEDWCYVERNVPPSVRIEGLRFSHHKLVAALPHDEQRRWLQMAYDNRWTVEEMREALRQDRMEESEPEVDDIVEPVVVEEPPGELSEEHYVMPDWYAMTMAFALGNDVQVIDTLDALAYLGDADPCLVYVDIDPDLQGEAAALLRQAFVSGHCQEAIFVSDTHPADASAYPLWEAGAAALLSEQGTIYYFGPNLSLFRGIFGEHGIVVRAAIVHAETT